MKNYDCTLVVNSCDKYADILDTFFELLHRFWPDLPFDIVLSTESLEYKNKYFKIRNVHPQNQNCTWTERMTDTLNSIKSNYCLFMLDDFFLYDYVKTKTVLDNLKVLKENPNIVNFTYWPILNDTEECIYPGFKKRKQQAKYKIAAVTSLWNKKQFLKYISGYKENIWEFEPKATIRSNTLYKDDEFYVSKDFPKQVFPYNFTKYGLFSGKWFKANKELFKRLNMKINFRKRGFYNEKKRGLTKSVISSFKLDSYIIPNYNLKEDNPLNKFKPQYSKEFYQKYKIKDAKDMIYWCLTDNWGFGVENLIIKVIYKDRTKEIIDNKTLFGTFRRIGKVLVFNTENPHVYIPTTPNKKITSLEISGKIIIPLSRYQLRKSYKYVTKPKNDSQARLKIEADKEMYLDYDLMSSITLYPNMHYYINNVYVPDKVLEFKESFKNNSFEYLFYIKNNTTAIEWSPSIYAGHAIKDLKIEYRIGKSNKWESLTLSNIENLPRYINDKYIFVEPKKLKINLKENTSNVRITGTISYPIEKEILSYVLNNEKSSKIREKVN